MKFILKHGKSQKDIVSLRQEIEILRGLRHENIIQMLDSFETDEEFCVVTEFAQGRSCTGTASASISALQMLHSHHTALQHAPRQRRDYCEAQRQPAHAWHACPLYHLFP